VGTAKRERQKANRQLKLQQIAKDAQKQRAKRWGLRIGIGVPLAIAVLFGLAWLARDEEPTESAVTTTTVDPLSVTTTVDPFAATTTVEPLAPTTTTPVTVAGATVTGETPCPEADGSSPRTITFEQAPPTCIDPAKKYTANIITNKGNLVVELDPVAAPLTVNNFVVLARYHYFDNTECHRIIPQFVVQCGDPTATGTGGPGYSFADELPTGAYAIGDLAMANSGADTNGSQFFVITGADGAALGPQYSKFGKVIAGLDDTVVELDAAGNPANNGVPPLQQVVIVSVSITES
jgi:cyclophilin family peptidyl-prolyl cis-trans isomerase